MKGKLKKTKPLLSETNIEKKTFDKNNSLALKGIAIIMMIFHHCFLSTERFQGFDVSFFPIGQTNGVQIAYFFKICVSIFAFISGYGLMISFKNLLNKNKNISGKEIGKWTLNRVIKTLSGYWIIVLLSLVICQIIDGRVATELFKSGTINGIWTIVLNFSGLAYLLNIPILNANWWYMSIAILFIVSVPILKKVINKYGYLICIVLVIAIPRIIGWKIAYNSYFTFILPVVLGMIFAEKNLMVQIANFRILKNNTILNKIIKFLLSTALIVVLFVVYKKISINQCWELHFTLIPLIYIIYFYEFWIELPIIKSVLQFLGKHSLNVFLVHEFLRNWYLRDFIYSQRNFVAIALMLLGISLTMSIAIEYLKKITKYNKLIDYITNQIAN